MGRKSAVASKEDVYKIQTESEIKVTEEEISLTENAVSIEKT